jgi:hypothetical protein
MMLPYINVVGALPIIAKIVKIAMRAGNVLNAIWDRA